MMSKGLGLDQLLLDGFKNLITCGRHKRGKYKEEMERRLENAKSYARKGEAELAEKELENVDKYRKLSKNPLTEGQYGAILKEAYRNGTLKNLHEARTYCEERDVERTMMKLEKALEYAPKSGLGDISIEAKDIENRARENYERFESLADHVGNFRSGYSPDSAKRETPGNSSTLKGEELKVWNKFYRS